MGCWDERKKEKSLGWEVERRRTILVSEKTLKNKGNLHMPLDLMLLCICSMRDLVCAHLQYNRSRNMWLLLSPQSLVSVGDPPSFVSVCVCVCLEGPTVAVRQLCLNSGSYVRLYHFRIVYMLFSIN